MSKGRGTVDGNPVDWNVPPKSHVQMARYEVTKGQSSTTMSDDSSMSHLFQCGLSMGGFIYTMFCIPFSCFGCGPVVKVNEGDRAAVLKFGKLDRILPPGSYYRNVSTEKFIIKSVKIQTITIPTQRVLTRDNVPVTLQAVCFYKIDDLEKAVFGISNCERATLYMAQSILETLLGEKTLEEILTSRQKIIARVTELIDQYTEEWGIHIQALEIRDIRVPQDMERLMAAAAEAQREGEAKVVMAAAELQAAETYLQAANVLSDSPGALQLRYFQTLSEIAVEKNNTILIPSEITNMFRPLSKWEEQESCSIKGKENLLNLSFDILFL